MNAKDEILESTREYLIKLEIGTKTLIEKIRTNKIEGTDYKKVSDIMEGMDWCLRAFQLTKEYYSSDEVLEITFILQEILNCVECKDNVLLADLLEYELLPKIINWNEKLNMAMSV